MDERVHQQAVTERAEREPESRSNVPVVVFGVSSIAFLLYVAFGSVEARIWRFGRLYFEDRSIGHVWSYFGDRLPDLPAQGFITALYWAALAVMVIGTVAGLWLFLGTSDEDPTQEIHVLNEEPAHPSSYA